ncbi:MAG TPA: DUF1512 domain-containing protein [Nitrosopumilus sp.]|nr:DUF1512 domain-containing protein [Thermoproteota archaeon]HJJ22381.1 DUF1512 domain-containing protein [Nitrosopumilus sp.]
MNFTNFDFDQLFAMSDDTNPVMMAIWIIPIILFVFYGQRIQLYITSSEIKKGIKKLDSFKEESRSELIDYVKNNLKYKDNFVKKIDRFLDYFTIMPVDMDPNGIVDKVRHTVRSREDYTREHVKLLSPEISDLELAKVQTLLEIASTLQMIYKIVNHMYLTAKKQNNYPLILPLQMLLPFIMEQAEAMKEAIPAFKAGQPVGDGIGPMVVGKMMLDSQKETIAFQTVLAKTEFEDRKLFLLKAEGPGSTVGRPADALETIVSDTKLDAIIMIDAALKMEGEDSASISQGFGAAIGGIGTERFQIEAIATNNKIPVFSIVVKQTVKEAITLMSKEIADQADDVRFQVYEMIQENTKQGQTVLIIGVGNTAGVPQ